MRRTLLGLAAVGLLLVGCGGGDDDDSAGGGEEVRGVEVIRVPPYVHTRAPVEYDRHPPVGGDHGPESAPCGFFTDPIEDKLLVHNLEHGVVWLAYATDLTDRDLETLEALAETYDDVVVTPYEDLEPGVAVVATSWGRQLTLDSVDDPRVEQFIEQYRRSAEAPERGIGC